MASADRVNAGSVRRSTRRSLLFSLLAVTRGTQAGRRGNRAAAAPASECKTERANASEVVLHDASASAAGASRRAGAACGAEACRSHRRSRFEAADCAAPGCEDARLEMVDGAGRRGSRRPEALPLTPRMTTRARPRQRYRRRSFAGLAISYNDDDAATAAGS